MLYTAGALRRRGLLSTHVEVAYVLDFNPLESSVNNLKHYLARAIRIIMHLMCL